MYRRCRLYLFYDNLKSSLLMINNEHSHTASGLWLPVHMPLAFLPFLVTMEKHAQGITSTQCQEVALKF